jgi:hypothetical protein
VQSLCSCFVVTGTGHADLITEVRLQIICRSDQKIQLGSGRPPAHKSPLTKTSYACMSWSLGVLSVKRLHWAIVVFGMCAVSILSIAPQADAPETPYNESETPFSFILPVRVNNVIRPLKICVAHFVRRFPAHVDHKRSATRAMCPSESHLSFLTKTLLC